MGRKSAVKITKLKLRKKKDGLADEKVYPFHFTYKLRQDYRSSVLEGAMNTGACRHIQKQCGSSRARCGT